MKTTVKIINMFFGKQPKTRFKRGAIIILIIGGIALMLFTCHFSYENGRFSFGTKPIKTEIKINKGE